MKALGDRGDVGLKESRSRTDFTGDFFDCDGGGEGDVLTFSLAVLVLVLSIVFFFGDLLKRLERTIENDVGGVSSTSRGKAYV